eukprot:GHVH01008125.1.p1 GENE.GHVH01008125.1~~GHVH01008125.1.p1  ORF type:complete len:147 (+),score=12.94 GHVH01008125.1:516-956(+)
MYASIQGGGAKKRSSLTGPFENLSTCSAISLSHPPSPTVVVASRSHLNDDTKNFVKCFEKVEFLQRGSSLKLVMCVDGEAHVYPRVAPTSEWDTCAAHAIVLEAGGTVNVLEKNECGVIEEKGPVQYNKENILNPWFVVFCPRRNE